MHRRGTWLLPSLVGILALSASGSAAAQSVVLRYAADGNRLVKQVGQTTVHYPFGDNYEVSGGVATKYVSLGEDIVAKVRHTQGTAAITWLHATHQGSTNTISNATGAEVQRYGYAPYGQRITTATAHFDSRTYTAQREDESRLYYLHARYYDAPLARFISPDPMVPSGHNVALNGYAYAGNDPANNTDINGLQYSDDGPAFVNPENLRAQGYTWVGRPPEHPDSWQNMQLRAMDAQLEEFKRRNPFIWRFTPGVDHRGNPIGTFDTAMELASPAALMLAGQPRGRRFALGGSNGVGAFYVAPPAAPLGMRRGGALPGLDPLARAALDRPWRRIGGGAGADAFAVRYGATTYVVKELRFAEKGLTPAQSARVIEGTVTRMETLRGAGMPVPPTGQISYFQMVQPYGEGYSYYKLPPEAQARARAVFEPLVSQAQGIIGGTQGTGYWVDPGPWNATYSADGGKVVSWFDPVAVNEASVAGKPRRGRKRWRETQRRRRARRVVRS
jgi:RHS repeat-associated protein